MIGHVVFRVAGRTIGLGVGIDAEHGEVAGLAGPHPVVGVAAELTHRLGNGKDQAQIVELLVNGGKIAVAFVERVYLHMERLVYLLYRVVQEVLQRVNEFAPVIIGYVPLLGFGPKAVGDVLLRTHERDEHVLVGQFFLVALGDKAVQHIVVFHGGMAADGLETAVVVGENQSVGTDHHARAIAREVHYAVLNGIGIAVECSAGQRETFLLHLCKHLRGQVVERPHSLVGNCFLRGKRREERGERDAQGDDVLFHVLWMVYDLRKYLPTTGRLDKGKSRFTMRATNSRSRTVFKARAPNMPRLRLSISISTISRAAKTT